MKHASFKRPVPAVLATLSLLAIHPAQAQSPGFTGDVGVGAVRSPAQIRGERIRTEGLPYLNAEYGRAFARIDTFGVKAWPAGYGHLELVGQYRSDGYAATGLQPRHDAVPLGLGTLQITPVGAFGLNVLRDFGRSKGTLVQARYLAELKFGRMALYPELGAEYQSRAYTDYYHGTTDQDAAFLGRSYRPGSATHPYVGAMLETRVAQGWYVNTYAKRSFSDNSITHSPLVSRRHRDSLLVAVARRF